MEQRKTLASEYPEIAKEWHPTKNGDITPDMIAPKSGKTMWWLGKCGHEWQAKVYSRTSGHGCPYCSNFKVIAGFNDLTTANPKLADEWHPTKNGTLLPSMVAPRSNKKVWWLGKCGHEWQAKVEGRYYGKGCPICAGKEVLPGYNDLITTCPNIGREWHPTKNGELLPTDVMARSHRKVWWLGKCGHEWQASISQRVNGCGCPYCSNRKVLLGFNDLATTHPELAKEWHPSKNGTKTPFNITTGSHTKIWWQCSKGHEWIATCSDRMNGTGCPVCATKTIISGENDFATKYPWLAKEWHPTKNLPLTPSQIAPKSGVKVWWMCENGHEYQARVVERARGQQCPVCIKEYRTSYPEQAILYYLKQCYPDVENGNNAEIGLELDIFIPSIKTAIEYDGVNWHKNRKTDHQKNRLCKEKNIFLIRVREEGLDQLNDCVCIFRHELTTNASLNPVIVAIFNMLNSDRNIDVDVERDEGAIYESYIFSKKEKSLERVAPDLAKEWHPTKNGALKPSMVSYGSKKRVWWLGICGHEWQADVTSRTRGYGCPICAGRIILEGFNDLATTAPNIAQEWHPTKNGNLTPTMIASHSSKKVWWLGKCGHEWQATPADRSRGRQCPYCSNKAILAGFNDLQTINPKLASEWHPTKNGNLNPTMVSARSSKKVWWLGKCGHEWQAQISSRARGNNCPY